VFSPPASAGGGASLPRATRAREVNGRPPTVSGSLSGIDMVQILEV